MKIKEFKDMIVSKLSEYGICPDIRNMAFTIYGDDEENSGYTTIIVGICIDNNMYHFNIDENITQEQLEHEEVLIDNLEIYREYIPCARWHCSIQSSIERIVANRINEIQH